MGIDLGDRPGGPSHAGLPVSLARAGYLHGTS